MTDVTFRPAKRHDVPLLVGLAGSTGSGKTLSALKLATGLAGGQRFALIDTESGRALHYAEEFKFDHAALEAPFRPSRYAAAIEAADRENYPVIVVDSTSHEHAGDGGLLDMHEEELERMAGNDARRRETMKMAAWIKPKMEHKRFLSRLLQVKAHVILCFRAEEKIEIAREDGKTVVRPKRSLTGLDGWIPICEARVPYELTLFALLTADAPGVPKPIKLPSQLRTFVPLDRPITEQVGAQLGAWAAGSAKPQSPTIKKLVEELLELAEQLSAVDKTQAAIAANASDHDNRAHGRWLRAQIKNAQEALAARADEPGENLFEAA